MSIHKVLFSFSGRINRRDYWLKGVIVEHVVIVLIFVTLLMGLYSVPSALFIPYAILMWVVLIFISGWMVLAVSAKRLRDLGQSGLLALPLLLLYVIPPVGYIGMVILGCIPSASGQNRLDQDCNEQGSERSATANGSPIDGADHLERPNISQRWPSYRDPMVLVGCVLALVMAVTGLFAPVLVPHDPLYVNPLKIHCPPVSCDYGSGSHFLGTDYLGRDVLSRIVASFRTYLYIGLLGTASGFLLATWAIVIARRVRGAASTPDMPRPLFGLSFRLLAILAYTTGVIASIVPLATLEDTSVVTFVVHGALFSCFLPAFLVYEHLERGRALDESGPASAVRRAIVVLSVCFSLAFLMGLLIESSLSFLGLGVPIPNPSLGAMISGGLTFFAEAPWVWGFPLGIIMVSVGALSAIVFRLSAKEKAQPR